MSANRRLCIEFKKGEKEVVQFIKLIISKLTRISSMKPSLAMKFINRWKDVEEHNKHYFRNTIIPLLKLTKEEETLNLNLQSLRVSNNNQRNLIK